MQKTVSVMNLLRTPHGSGVCLSKPEGAHGKGVLFFLPSLQHTFLLPLLRFL